MENTEQVKNTMCDLGRNLATVVLLNLLVACGGSSPSNNSLGLAEQNTTPPEGTAASEPSITPASETAPEPEPISEPQSPTPIQVSHPEPEDTDETSNVENSAPSLPIAMVDTSASIELTNLLNKGARLTWTSENAENCRAGGAWSGTLPTHGTQTISNVAIGASFNLICTNGSQQTVAMVSVVSRNVEFSWQANTVPFKHYKLYLGDTSLNYSDSVVVPPDYQQTSLQLQPGNYYLSLVWVDPDGVERNASHELQISVL